MGIAMSVSKAFTWQQLSTFCKTVVARDASECRLNGPTNAQTHLRLFGQPETAARVTLFRDNHAWCPYCQKIWLWLEEKRVPYKIQKVTMFCYGEKEAWYKKKVPSGMLPAIEMDGQIVTESDVILHTLESQYGPLYHGMDSDPVFP